MPFASKKLMDERGKIHHLGLGVGEVAPSVILTAEMEQVPVIAGLLEGAVETGRNREYLTYTGTAGGVPVSVMSTGNGCMPMAIAAEELFHLGCTALLKVGVGFALQPDCAPGALLTATASVRGEGTVREYVGPEYPAVSDPELWEEILAAAGERGERLRSGIFRSHDAYYLESPFAPDGGERADRWRALGVELIEHETSALFVLGTILGMRTGALYVAKGNLSGGDALSPAQLEGRLHTCYEIAVRAIERMAKRDG
ncbi:hypothetical protein LJB68_12630 [bacterium 210820-DFI.6.52]|nr:hypothetical protein [bacterium 210820-DFI.6.52]